MRYKIQYSGKGIPQRIVEYKDVNGDLLASPNVTNSDDVGFAALFASLSTNCPDTFNPEIVEIENGATWTPPANTLSFTIRVNGASNGSTFDGISTPVRTLDDNEVITWGGDGKVVNGSPVVTTGNPAAIVISYTTL